MIKKLFFIAIILTLRPYCANAALQCECEPAGIDGVGGEIINSGECCSDGVRCCTNGNLNTGGSNICTNCESTNWAAYTTGYQKRTNATCVSGRCRKTSEYRCANNYYGTSDLSGTSGCNPCPNSGKSSAGSTSITSCYVTTFSDTPGSGTYTNNCYYTN